MKAEWKFAGVDHGVLSVIMDGAALMLKWCADNLDMTTQMVLIINLLIVNTKTTGAAACIFIQLLRSLCILSQYLINIFHQMHDIVQTVFWC